MSDDAWIYLAAAFMVLGIIAYAVLAGADFGGGVWDLFAAGPRKRDQQNAIAHAMGPVWEANHVWLIFVIVILFTCFPKGFVILTTALFAPLHLALLGIMLRGASFVFRGHGRKKASLPGERLHTPLWRALFGISSVLSPLLLGAAFGSVTSGTITVRDGRLAPSGGIAWLSPYAIGCALLALSACAYLAAVFLCKETEGSLREDFRRRAILAGTTTAALALIVLPLAAREATWFFHRLLAPASAPIIIAGLTTFALSAWAVFARRYALARIFAAAEITLLLLGWAIAHRPYLIFPDMTLQDAAGPAASIRFVVVASALGMAILLPSLLLLFRVFKSDDAAGH
jgi:cytochrome d ubiquinol oxidase subunit II